MRRSHPNFTQAGLAVVALLLIAIAGCSHHDSAPKRVLTDRERDSIIATEKALPGSAVVGRALALSDAEAARAKRMNQQVDSSAEPSGDGH